MEIDRRLTELVGDWSGVEQVSATSWTTAGEARGALSIAPGPGGIILDYVQQREGADPFVAHGVLSGQGWWWFDSLGFEPTTPGIGGWQDDMLVLERSSERGRNVMGLMVRDGSLHVHIATAAPGESLAPLSSGVYAKRAGAH